MNMKDILKETMKVTEEYESDVDKVEQELKRRIADREFDLDMATQQDVEREIKDILVKRKLRISQGDLEYLASSYTDTQENESIKIVKEDTHIVEAQYRDPGTGEVMDIKIVKDLGSEVEILDPAKHPAGPGSEETKDTIKVSKSDLVKEDKGEIIDIPDDTEKPVREAKIKTAYIEVGDEDTITNLQEALLKTFGLNVYIDPLSEGTDSLWILISNAPLSDDQLKLELDNYRAGGDYDEEEDVKNYMRRDVEPGGMPRNEIGG